MNEITLCMVVRDHQRGTKRAVESVGDIVREILIVDQGSEARESQHLKKLATIYLRRTPKGYADPDRQYAYDTVPTEWILSLDSDEYLSPALKEKIPQLVQLPFDVFWFKFRNLIDGVNIRDLLGDDYHPRLFRKGSLIWPAQAHTYPQIRTPRQYFCSTPIVHSRTFEEVLRAHELRKPKLTPPQLELELRFIDNLRRKLGK